MYDVTEVNYRHNFNYLQNYPCTDHNHANSLLSAAKTFFHNSLEVFMESTRTNKKFQNSFCIASEETSDDVNKFFISLPWKKSSGGLSEGINTLTTFGQGWIPSIFRNIAFKKGMDTIIDPFFRTYQGIPGVFRIGLQIGFVSFTQNAPIARYTVTALGAGKWACDKIRDWFWRGIDMDRLLG